MARAPQQTRDDAPVRALRARLRELTLRDEHRLVRRLDKLRRTADPDERARALAGLVARDREGRGARRAPPRRRARRSPIRRSCRSAPAATDLLAAIRDNQVVVVAGETGSGKTTQLPKICLELGRGVRGAIGHTQPRRHRRAHGRRADRRRARTSPLGEAVGYAVRFSDRSSEDTLVRLDDRRPAARRDPARPAAAPLRHDHRRRGARAQPQHRLPARLPRSGSCRGGPT